MRDYISPKIFSDFNNYLTDIKNNTNDFEIQRFKNFSKSFLDFLNVIYNENFRKRNYSDEHIAEQIFLTEIKSIKEYYKLTILAIMRTYSRIESNIEYFCKINNQSNLNNEIRLFSDLLSNSIAFLQSTDLKYSGIKSKYRIIRSNFVNSSQVYEASKKLFHENIDKQCWSITAIRHTSIFLIRQSIELKLKNSIGLINVNSNDNPIKFRNDLIIDFIKENEEYFKFPVNFPILRKIYNWTNYYIHTGIFGYFW